jgi:hypothetical protein
MTKSVYKSASKSQRVWNYIRRNKNFTVEDVLILVDIEQKYLMRFLGTLVKMKYLVCSKKKRIREREYRVIKVTGIVAPIFSNSGFYDPNIELETIFKKRESKKRIPAVLSAVSIALSKVKKEISQTELLASTKKGRKQVGYWLKKLESEDILFVQKKWGKNYISVDQKKLSKLRQTLQDGRFYRSTQRLRSIARVYNK